MKTPGPQGLKKKNASARERTYAFIKSHVLSGGFSPGERLTEESLAGRLGVSRTPVREALHKLELEGLIEPLETRGFCVPRGSRDEVEELFDLRAILEGYTLRLVCETIDEEALAQLSGFVDKAEAALRDQKSDEIFQWNTRFHDQLQSLVAHKGRLYSLIVNMRKYVLRYRKDTLYRLDASKRTVDGHHRILLALRLGDPDLCERVMRQHIQQAKEDALVNLSAGRGSAS